MTLSYHHRGVTPGASDDFSRENTHGDGDANLQDEQDQEDALESVKKLLKDATTKHKDNGFMIPDPHGLSARLNLMVRTTPGLSDQLDTLGSSVHLRRTSRLHISPGHLRFHSSTVLLVMFQV